MVTNTKTNGIIYEYGDFKHKSFEEFKALLEEHNKWIMDNAETDATYYLLSVTDDNDIKCKVVRNNQLLITNYRRNYPYKSSAPWFNADYDYTNDKQIIDWLRTYEDELWCFKNGHFTRFTFDKDDIMTFSFGR